MVASFLLPPSVGLLQQLELLQVLGLHLLVELGLRAQVRLRRLRHLPVQAWAVLLVVLQLV